MRIQSNLGSTIAMAFDECVENPAEYDYAKNSCARTARWLRRCKAEMNRLNALPDTINPNQMLFGINQGCTYIDLRLPGLPQVFPCLYSPPFQSGGDACHALDGYAQSLFLQQFDGTHS